MKRQLTSATLILFSTSLLLAQAPSASPSAESSVRGTFEGEVVTNHGRPITKTRVSITGPLGTKTEITRSEITDEEGHFLFPLVELGKYAVKVFWTRGITRDIEVRNNERTSTRFEIALLGDCPVDPALEDWQSCVKAAIRKRIGENYQDCGSATASEDTPELRALNVCARNNLSAKAPFLATYLIPAVDNSPEEILIGDSLGRSFLFFVAPQGIHDWNANGAFYLENDCLDPKYDFNGELNSFLAVGCAPNKNSTAHVP